jgi:hypothetical protein
MKMLKTINLALAFGLELALLGAMWVWAFAVLPGGIWQFGVAIGLSAVVIVLWGIWAAPRSTRRLGMPWLYVFKIAIFAVGVAALIMARQPVWGGVFAVLAALNLGLALAWGQEPVNRRP